MYRDHTVGVVVPAYNEAEFVGDVVARLPSFVDRVYVIDDHSTDGTWDEVRSLVDCDRTGNDDGTDANRDGAGTTVIPVRHDQNRGAGGAIQTGYRHAHADRMDVTVTIDADGQMDPGRMDDLLDPIVEGAADYAKGNRLASPSHCAEMPPFRLVGNWLLTVLTRVASGYWSVTDPQNGYTAISWEALDAIDLDDLFEYYAYCNDLLVKLSVADMRVTDVPMPAIYGDEQSGIDYSTYVLKVSVMLLENFLWRLHETGATRGPNPGGRFE